ncbi:MAG: hypothetical protein ACI9I0_000782 [Rhodoferax sp.]|jgi:hypothetical protein
MMRHPLPLLGGLFLALALSACSSYAPPDPLVGMSREALVASMGQPDLTRQVAGGSRLEYPRGPFGKETWFVYFDVEDRAVRADQVLIELNFNRLRSGMAQEEVRQLLGRPSDVKGLGRDRGMVWSYRYHNYLCQWFQVELSQQQQVRSSGYAQSPECQGRGEFDLF